MEREWTMLRPEHFHVLLLGKPSFNNAFSRHLAVPTQTMVYDAPISIDSQVSQPGDITHDLGRAAGLLLMFTS